MEEVGLDNISGVVREEVILVFIIHVFTFHDTDGDLESLIRKDWNGWVRSKGLLMESLEERGDCGVECCKGTGGVLDFVGAKRGCSQFSKIGGQLGHDTF